MRARQNIIVSHGGRHGAQSRTHMKGTKIARASSKHIPNRFISAPTEEPAVSGKVAASPRARGKEGQSGEAAIEAAKPAAPTPAPVDAPPPPPPPAEPSKDEVDLPTSKRQLTLMKKAEMVKLAEALDVDTSGMAEDIRGRLTEELGL